MVRKLFLSCLFSLQKNFLLYLLVLVGDLFMEWSPDGEHKAHCTKKRISQVLKDQANIIFTSTFWLKKSIFHHQKVQSKNFLAAQNNNFSVISKYHLSINFLSQKKTYFPSPKSSKQERFSNK